MKYLLLILLLSSISYADNTSVELIGGSITYHVMDDGASSHYVTKWSPDGRLIFNQLYGVKLLVKDNDSYSSMTYFGGNNSIGSPIYGGIVSYGVILKDFNVGLAIGGYMQDDNAFRSVGVEPYRLTEIGSSGLVPVVGVEINYKVDLSDTMYLKLNNLLSPVITNTSLSLGFNL